MSEHELPRYFVPSDVRSEQPGNAARSAPDNARAEASLDGVEARGSGRGQEIEHCVDSFCLLSHGVTHEVIVGVDRLRELTYTMGSERSGMSERALRELGVHELLCASAQRAPVRSIQAERLFLFEMEFLEQVGGGSELNPPVYAYGTLLGPLPGKVGQMRRVRGQLAVTRADLLEGFAMGSELAFRCADEPGQTRAVYHALLPGGRSEEIAQGKDVLLAYPLPPAELADVDLENAAIVQLLVAELVQALQSDLLREERARGVLEKWFGTSRAASLAAPETLDFAGSMALATAALRCIPAWPGERAKALRARIVNAPASVEGRGSEPEHNQPARSGMSPAAAEAGPSTITHTANGSALVTAKAPHAAIWKKTAAAPPDWARDFLPEQHRDDPSASYVTWKVPRAEDVEAGGSERAQGEKGPKRKAIPAAWMADFRAARAAEEREQEGDSASNANENAARPDWMRDFDDE